MVTSDIDVTTQLDVRKKVPIYHVTQQLTDVQIFPLLENKDLFVSAPLLSIEGNGTADLTQDKLKYLIKTKVVGTLKGQDGKDLSELMKKRNKNPKKKEMKSRISSRIKQKIY